MEKGRRSLLIAWLFCLLSSHVHSQAFLSQAGLGIKGGFVSARIGGDVRTFGVGKVMLGGVALFPVHDSYHLKAELQFIGLGAGDATRRRENGRWDYTYLNLPILLSFHPFVQDWIKLEVGLQPGILLDAWYADRGNKFNIRPETRNLDLALLLGGAYHFNERWFADLRLGIGLRDHSLRTWTGDRYYNQSVQIGVGYFLNMN